MNKERLKEIYNQYPKSQGSNTEFFIAVLHDELFKNGSFMPRYIADTIRKLKPEYVMRVRREFAKGTKEQFAESIRYRQEFKPDNPNPNFEK